MTWASAAVSRSRSLKRKASTHLRSSVDSILAAGDIASFPLSLAEGRRVAIGHWQLAHYLGSVAGRNAAGTQTEVNTVPFFWTMQYGKSVRYTGYCPSFDDIIY
ncbi:Apoptosis-inducing factor 3 [Amphibalanus amphitrite]|uniref:Apoptosis-inducing factor 3 n=1 Tax=Amphibalanus amphitrite TaxID=1232801 RepID=A0A6A4WAK0_AMPAM|nr:Apoptosis-inducing factor 3 [Amphibalanus amphitrite]